VSVFFFLIRFSLSSPLGHLLIPILVNKERVAEDEVYSLVMRKGLILSAGINGFANFSRMANLLWVCPEIDDSYVWNEM
jgi:hypothetical protein